MGQVGCQLPSKRQRLNWGSDRRGESHGGQSDGSGLAAFLFCPSSAVSGRFLGPTDFVTIIEKEEIVYLISTIESVNISAFYIFNNEQFQKYLDYAEIMKLLRWGKNSSLKQKLGIKHTHSPLMQDAVFM